MAKLPKFNHGTILFAVGRDPSHPMPVCLDFKSKDGIVASSNWSIDNAEAMAYALLKNCELLRRDALQKLQTRQKERQTAAQVFNQALINLELVALGHRYLQFVKKTPVITEDEYQKWQLTARAELPLQSLVHQKESERDQDYSDDVRLAAKMIAEGREKELAGRSTAWIEKK